MLIIETEYVFYKRKLDATGHSTPYIGSAIGLVITTTGVGGGVILLPVLIYLFGMNALAAVATANLLSMLMKISSSYIHFV